MVVRLAQKLRTLLPRIGNAYRKNFALCAQRIQRAVVIAAAIAETMTARVESEQRHENDIGRDGFCIGARLRDAVMIVNERITLAPFAEEERCAFRIDA